MIKVLREEKNPIIGPHSHSAWEAAAAFNGSVVFDKDKFHLVYRGTSNPRQHHQNNMQVSSIGYANSTDGINFKNRRQLIKPDLEWERFGCEDPRITKIGDKYYIFYTALSTYPFGPDGIKIGLAITKDFKSIKKHPVTPFNSKAMALFPNKINGKFAALLSVDTDRPPVKIGLALFSKESDMWSQEYWDRWHESIGEHMLPLQRTPNDHVEIGAPPIKTNQGWLLIYSYIENYFKPPAIFSIEAALLDLKNPQRLICTAQQPLLEPDEDYEIGGRVPNVVFPSGAVVRQDKLMIYYGAADTTTALATTSLSKLLKEMQPSKPKAMLKRYNKNPILEPDEKHDWEDVAVFNPTAICLNNKIHIIYRAMGHASTSVMGYASSSDGFIIDERPSKPIYVPRKPFEKKKKPGNSGCEDGRITKVGNTIYLTYTAYDGINAPRVALSSISVKNFVAQKWSWTPPLLISPPGADDKDAAFFPQKINGKFAILHRLGISIWLDHVSNLEFKGSQWLLGSIIMDPRPGRWDSRKIGIAGAPIETKIGWLLFYHGIGRDFHYRLGAALLDKKDPSHVIARSHEPILQPETDYERNGIVNNVVFPCGQVERKGTLYVYYGGADKVIGVATIEMERLLNYLRQTKNLQKEHH